MENTGKVHFADDKAQWFISLADQAVGPLLGADVFRRIEQGELNWGNYIWKQGMGEWERICDVPEFKALMPPKPSASAANQLLQKSKAASGSTPPPPPVERVARPWFLHYSDAQYGPFSTEEIRTYLVAGRINQGVHIWKEGMAGWETLEKVAQKEPQLTAGLGAPSIPKAPKENRSSPRKPFIARILLASGESVSTAICRDISIGGMQVLTDANPGKPGTRIKVNVSPDGAGAGHPKGNIKPFVAEGVIVRILEDGRGFSYRFEKLGEEAKKAIEEYVRQDS